MKKERIMKDIFKKTSVAMMITSLFTQTIPFATSAFLVKSTAAVAAIGAGLMFAENAHAQAAKSVVSLTLSQPLKSDPAMFNLSGTNKIIVDLAGVDRTFQAPPVVENDPLLEKISSKLVGDKVRLAIDTKKPVKFNFIKEDGKILLVFESSESFINANAPVVVMPKTEANAVDTKTAKPNLAGVSNTWTQTNQRPLTGVSDAERNAIIEKVRKATGSSAPVIATAPVQLETKEVSPLVNPSVTPVSSVVANPGAVFTELKRINVKRDGSRNTKLTVDLSDKSIVPNITKQGTKLIVDFPNTSIPNELQRRVNTETIGSITQVMDVSMQKSNGRIILEQKDNWDYSFYQLEKQFVVDVKSVESKEDEKRYVGKTLSINFQDMDVRAILQVIADFTGLNIMSSDQVTGTMTIRLKDVPWDQALDLVLESRGLQKVKEGNVIWVATSDEVKKNNEAKLDLKTQNEKLEPLKLEFFQINYYKADELKTVLEGKTEQDGTAKERIKLLSPRGSVGVDARNNMVFVQDTESSLKEVRRLIKKLDIPTKQVLIEAKIVIADDTFGRELGAKFGLRARATSGNRVLGVGGNILESGQVAGSPGTAVTPLVNLAAVGSNTVTPGAIGLTLLNTVSGNALGFELSALEQNNRGKVLSNPRLLTTDNKKAVIEQGSEVPYVTPGTATSPATVTFKKAVLSLGVTPQIAPNGRIVMNLQIRKDTIGQLINIQGGGQIPAIDTKNIDTQVTVNNGQTVVLGGVYEIANRNDVSKIPFFGDLPVVGNLFKNTNKTEEKGELLIFITPYIVEDQDLDTPQDAANSEIELVKK